MHKPLSSEPKQPRLPSLLDVDTLPPTQGCVEGKVGGEVRLEQLLKEKGMLKSKLKETEGQLSKLKLVKLYRSKVSALVLVSGS